MVTSLTPLAALIRSLIMSVTASPRLALLGNALSLSMPLIQKQSRLKAYLARSIRWRWLRISFPRLPTSGKERLTATSGGFPGIQIRNATWLRCLELNFLQTPSRPTFRRFSRGNSPKSSGELNFLPSLKSALRGAASKSLVPILPAVITKTTSATLPPMESTFPENSAVNLPISRSPEPTTTLITSGGKPGQPRMSYVLKAHSSSSLNTKAARSGDWRPIQIPTSTFSPLLSVAATGELLTPTTLLSSRLMTLRTLSTAGTATATTGKSFLGPATSSPTGSVITRRFRCLAHALPPTSRSMVSWMKSLISSTMIRWNRWAMRQPQIRAGRGHETAHRLSLLLTLNRLTFGVGTLIKSAGIWKSRMKTATARSTSRRCLKAPLNLPSSRGNTKPTSFRAGLPASLPAG